MNGHVQQALSQPGRHLADPLFIRRQNVSGYQRKDMFSVPSYPKELWMLFRNCLPRVRRAWSGLQFIVDAGPTSVRVFVESENLNQRKNVCQTSSFGVWSLCHLFSPPFEAFVPA
jgi:hypothetical protein